jgi:uncharacterized protein DUF6894|tara:strand:+ start:7546 stop:7773 length:228 start_codon:yes stop_codon:yes gene_type:complete
MSVYYFNVSDGDCDRDEKGVDFADEKQALRGGVQYAGELLQHNPDLLKPSQNLQVKILDKMRREVMTVSMRMQLP